jgi:tRNA(fMet)-specific endonuclease VapC
MAMVVVDTEVVSFLFKNDTRAVLYRPHIESNTPLVSFMTVAELDRWAIQNDWGAERRRKMEAHLQRFVLHPVDRALCREWGEVSNIARRNGRPIQTADAWIAATARLYVYALVTHNPGDYSGVDGHLAISESTG